MPAEQSHRLAESPPAPHPNIPPASPSDPRDPNPLDDPRFARACLQALLDGPDAVVYVKDVQSRFVLVSGATAGKHGLSAEAMVGLSDADLFTSEHADFALAEEQQIMTTGASTAYKEVRETWPDGSETWAVTTKRPLRDEAGRIVGLVGISQDVTARVVAERRAADALAEVRASEARLRTVLDNSPDAIARLDPQLDVRFANAAALDLLRASASAVVGRRLPTSGPLGPVTATVEETAREVLADGIRQYLEARADDDRWFQIHLSPLRASDGRIESVVVSARDVTETKATQERLSRQALTDPVTGLANRVLLEDRLRQAVARLEGRQAVAVVFVDLDRFKAINDEHGHHVGDAVLVEVGRRLTAAARRQDTVARQGGDEFVVLCDTVPERDGAAELGDRLVTAVSRPLRVYGVDVDVSASAGVVLLDRTSRSDPVDVLRRADAAMYAAKHAGGGRARLASV